jgi:hypothetical protein
LNLVSSVALVEATEGVSRSTARVKLITLNGSSEQKRFWNEHGDASAECRPRYSCRGEKSASGARSGDPDRRPRGYERPSLARPQAVLHRREVRERERGEGVHRVLGPPAIPDLGEATQRLHDVKGWFAHPRPRLINLPPIRCSAVPRRLTR